MPVGNGRTAPRNPLGFIDGIVGPHTTTEQQRDLWLAGPPAVAGGTLAVLRRMELDLPRFAALSTAEQEAVFGRRWASGVPSPAAPSPRGRNSEPRHRTDAISSPRTRTCAGRTPPWSASA
ncbi:Dyp-type peroxidase [Streptomyces albulus]|nr:Dyp-type peroxidase [Streptomyces noursei]